MERQKASKSKDDQLQQNIPVVYEACLFGVPPSTEETFIFKTKGWQKLIKSNMQDPEFRKLLVSAPAIEEYITEHVSKIDSSQHHMQINKSMSRSSGKQNILEKAKKEVISVTKEYKRIRDKRIQDEDSLTVEEKELYAQYGNNLLKAQLNLVNVSAHLMHKLEDMSIVELKAYSNKYKFHTEAQFKYILSHGLTKEDYAKFVTLKRHDDNERIPPILIDGKDIGYTGYYLRRLNVEDTHDGAMAACLGKLSNCCQSLSGETGEPCTIHGLTSSNGGFYVVIKGDISNPSPQDQLVCQSWVWRSKSDAIVIDSVESEKESKEDINIMVAFYRELAYKLVKFYEVHGVFCGNVGWHSKKLQLDSFSLTGGAEIPEDYNEYRDSRIQFMVCDTNSLYLIPGKEQDFFTLCQKKNFGADHLIFIKMLNFALKQETEDPILLCYKQNLIKEYKKIFNHDMEHVESIINTCTSYLKACKDKNITAAISMASKAPYLCIFTDKHGNNLLHMIAKNSELLRQVLEFLSQESRLEILLNAIKEKNKNSDDLLHKVAENPESLRQILKLLPEESRVKILLDSIKEKNENGDGLLHIAAKNFESLKQILIFLPEKNRLDAIKEKNYYDDDLLHVIADSPKCLRQVLELLPKESRSEVLLDVVKEKNKNSDDLLHKVAENPESLRLVLEFLPEKSRLGVVLKAIKEKNKNGDGLLHIAAGNHESLKQVLELLPKESRLEILLNAIKEKNQRGDGVLHIAAENLESLKQVLKFLLENNRLDAVEEKNQKGNGLLHTIAGNPEYLRQTLEFLPEEIRVKILLDAVKEKNQYGDSLLHIVAENPESFQQVLEFLSKESRLDILLDIIKEKNQDGDSLLHIAARKPESLQQILELLPKESRVKILLDAVREKNQDGNGLLHIVVENLESLRQILKLLPKESILDAIKEKNQYDDGLLHIAARKPESLRQILKLLPEESRVKILLDAVKEKNQYGDGLLHIAARKPESLQQILELLPKESRVKILLDAVREKNQRGDSLLDIAAENCDSLRQALELLPKENRLNIVIEKDRYGFSVLSKVATVSPEFLQKVLEFLPIEGRLDAVKEKNYNGEDLLQIAAKSPESLRKLLELLPEESRLNLVKEKVVPDKPCKRL